MFYEKKKTKNKKQKKKEIKERTQGYRPFALSLL